MMTLSEYLTQLNGKRITVLGMGVSNRPLIRLLLDAGCDVTVRDKAPREKLGDDADAFEAAGCRFVLGDGYLDDIDADVIFRSPGIRPDLPPIAAALAKGAVLTSEMEAFFEVCPAPIIAVTGSDGKTTTTTVISRLLEKAGRRVYTGGNIGTPLLDKADGMRPDDICVLELSSFQLMTLRRSPRVAVVTNVAPNHLDIHKDMAEYVAAKKNIFANRPQPEAVVLNADNEITAGFAAEVDGETRLFSRTRRVEDGVYLEDGVIFDAKGGKAEPIMRAEDILIPGVHNVENYMAAFAAVRGLVSREDMVAVARSFGGVEHRIELVRELHGVRYYNDSIASSPSRTTAGLRSFRQKVILIAGGKDKGVPFDALGAEIREHVKALVVTGMTADKIMRAAIDAGFDGTILKEKDFREAVVSASRLAEEGDVVLLSPASTSFDRFKNFEERGRYFKEIVQSLE